MTEEMQQVKEWISNADALLIGASNGLSIAEGYHIFANNEMFRRQFGDYQQRFGIMNVIQGCFYNYPSADDRNEFFRRLVKYWVKDYTPSQVMKDLLAIVGDKPYFIVTSNGDTHLELSGFNPARVFEIEGTFTNEFAAVDDKTLQLQEFVKPFLEQREQSRNNFSALSSRDENAHNSEQYNCRKLVILELGIGMRNTLVKRPLMQLAASLPRSRYITLNLERELYIPPIIANRSIGLAGDIARTLHELNS